MWSNFQPKYFNDLRLPEGVRLVGYSALVHILLVKTPLRNHPCCVSNQFSKSSKPMLKNNLLIYSKRYWPGERLQDHLEFALRHETLDLLCLIRILKKVPDQNIIEMVSDKPTGIYSRRIWFLFEYINQKKLDIRRFPEN